jgi:hypothetical protein
MNEKLTFKQQRAIEALLTTCNITLAAQKVNVSRETLYRWMKNDAFYFTLQESTQLALEGLNRSLIDLGAKALFALSETLESATSSPAIKVKAAEIVLDRLLQLYELVELEKRVYQLEVKNEINSHKPRN